MAIGKILFVTLLLSLASVCSYMAFAEESQSETTKHPQVNQTPGWSASGFKALKMTVKVPMTSAQYLKRGRIKQAQSDYLGAVKDFREALMLNDDVTAHNSLASALSSLGRTEEAAKERELGVRKQPTLYRVGNIKHDPPSRPPFAVGDFD